MQKHVVFDFDETIGYFDQFLQVVNALQPQFGTQLDAYIFLLDLFPEWFRPNIFNIIKLILEKKRAGVVNHIVLYSNNTNIAVVEFILSFMAKRLGVDQIFDSVVTSSHPGRLHPTRKCLEDLVHCCDVPAFEPAVCFIDDRQHPSICKQPTVYYIYCKCFKYYVSRRDLVKRLRKHGVELDVSGFKERTSPFTWNMYAIASEDLLSNVLTFLRMEKWPHHD
jgi:hypothetical protein